MKVLSSPDLSTWKYQLTCDTCNSKLEADQDDVCSKIESKFYSGTMGDAGYYANNEVFYVTCSMCYKELNVHPGDIPYLLKEKIKAKK